MKRIVTLMIVGLFMFGFSAHASGFRKDVVIAWDQLGLDASFKQFKKANKINQQEILTALLARANEEYYKCKSIEEIYDLRDKLQIIRFYNERAKQEFITVTNGINKLNRKLIDVEAKYKKTHVILNSRDADNYSGWGQELD